MRHQTTALGTLRTLGIGLVLCLAIGIVAGLSCALFLVALDVVTATREANLWLVACLPLAGFVLGWVWLRYGQPIAGGMDQVLSEAQAPQQRLPLRMAPMILLGTLFTHLVGGSAGREGTAVQMGAALADQLTRWSVWARQNRSHIILAGMSGGFAALFGTPWAAGVFAIEVLARGGWRWSALPGCMITAWIGHGVVVALGVPHVEYAIAAVPTMNGTGLIAIVVAAVAFGLMARALVLTQHTVATLAQQRLPWLPLRVAVGGAIVAVIALALGSTRHLGLGIPLIDEAFAAPLPFSDSVLKLLLTAITLGFGFKGGEVTPLFAMGAALGSALAIGLPIPVDLLAALGFIAVFAAAAKTPVACIIMAMELFGPAIGWHAALACAVAATVSGAHGIYRARSKPSLTCL